MSDKTIWRSTGHPETTPFGKNADFGSVRGKPKPAWCDRLSGPETVSHRPQTQPTPDLLTPSQAQQHATEMELHHRAESVKLIFRRPLAARLKAVRFQNTAETEVSAACPARCSKNGPERMLRPGRRREQLPRKE